MCYISTPATYCIRPKKIVLFWISASFWKRVERSEKVFLFYFFRVTVSLFEEEQSKILPTWLLSDISQNITFGRKKMVITL